MQEADERGKATEFIGPEMDALLTAEGLLVDAATRTKLASGCSG